MCLLEVLLLLEQKLLLLLSSQTPLACPDWRRRFLLLLKVSVTSLLHRHRIRLETARMLLLSITLPSPMTQTVYPRGKRRMHLPCSTSLLLRQSQGSCSLLAVWRGLLCLRMRQALT